MSSPRKTRSKSVLRSGQELLALLKDTRLAALMRAIELSNAKGETGVRRIIR